VFIVVCSLLRKNIKRAKAIKKFGQKKEKKKIAKEKRRDKKGAHKEHSIALLFVVPFALSIFSLLSFILVSLPCVSQLVLGTRIGQQLGQVLWTFIQYCYLLLNCMPHIYLFFVCLPSSTYILHIRIEKDPCNLGATPSQVSRTSHRFYHPLHCVGKNLVRT
jgi:hypothetical protein